MCTAIMVPGRKCCFGRNLDLSYHYSESVAITPRKYLLKFCDGQKTDSHYAIIGIANVINDYPLYYDAMNEKGLYIAALNFPGNAVYQQPRTDKTNVASYELIPWLLSQCNNVGSAKQALQSVNITNNAFNDQLQPTPLHWMIADQSGAIVLETTAAGMHLYDNPARVLTNNPPFPFQLYNLQNFIKLSVYDPDNNFSSTLKLKPDSLGMGAIGLPGDLSSSSRFVRAAFHLHNAMQSNANDYNVTQVFHILNTVAQTEGCVDDDGKPVKTVYSSCCDAEHGIYYYTTYENFQITAICLNSESMKCETLVSYPLRTKQNYLIENGKRYH